MFDFTLALPIRGILFFWVYWLLKPIIKRKGILLTILIDVLAGIFSLWIVSPKILFMIKEWIPFMAIAYGAVVFLRRKNENKGFAR